MRTRLLLALGLALPASAGVRVVPGARTGAMSSAAADTDEPTADNGWGYLLRAVYALGAGPWGASFTACP